MLSFRLVPVNLIKSGSFLNEVGLVSSVFAPRKFHYKIPVQGKKAWRWWWSCEDTFNFFFSFFFSHDPEENYGKLYKLQRFIINDSIFASSTVKKNVRKLNFKRSNPKIRRRRARILQFIGYRINAFSRIFVADSSSLIHYSDILRLIHPPAGLTFGIRFNRARPSSGSWLAALDRIVCNRNAWRKLAHM